VHQDHEVPSQCTERGFHPSLFFLEFCNQPKHYTSDLRVRIRVEDIVERRTGKWGGINLRKVRFEMTDQPDGIEVNPPPVTLGSGGTGREVDFGGVNERYIASLVRENLFPYHENAASRKTVTEFQAVMHMKVRDGVIHLHTRFGDADWQGRWKRGWRNLDFEIL